MKIELRVSMTGTRNGQDWPPIGSVVDLPDDEAQQMLAVGLAVLPGEPEAAAVVAPENAATRKPRARKQTGLTKANGV